jgi:AcrR family transcriptional regulator
VAGPEINLRELPPRERIVYAAMACLERTGLQGLTVRAIAAEAGVNVAAVNYYFGGKDALLAEMRARQLATGFLEPLAELDMLLAIPDMPRREALRQFFHGFIQDMCRYPRTVEAHLHDGLVRQDYSGPAFSGLTAFMEGILECTRDMLAPGSEVELRTSVAQLWSAILFLGILPGATSSFLGGSAVDDAALELYAARLVEHFFPRA